MKQVRALNLLLQACDEGEEIPAVSSIYIFGFPQRKQILFAKLTQ
jgi:hypothetical protein